MHLHDTILAISSPPPSGGGPRAILRLSGPHAFPLAKSLLPNLPQQKGFHQNLALPLLHPNLKIPHALLFQSPPSFTGQNIAELPLPNSPALLNTCINPLLQNARTQNLPARLANPG